MTPSTSDISNHGPREYVSHGFRVHKQISVRDPNDRSKVLATIGVGPQDRISFRFRGKPRPRSHRLTLARLKLQRERDALRKQRWHEYAEPVVRGDSSIATPELDRLLREVERLLSRLAESTCRARVTRVQPQTLCGSRPYFPAAPP
jgi:hypothetical protein